MIASLKPRNLILRCFAEQDQDETWFVICLDLNLYARADTLQEAKYKLNRLISCYLNEAVVKDAEYIGDLIPRRAPLHFWLRYMFFMMIEHIHHFASRHFFKLPLPLVPAS